MTDNYAVTRFNDKKYAVCPPQHLLTLFRSCGTAYSAFQPLEVLATLRARESHFHLVAEDTPANRAVVLDMEDELFPPESVLADHFVVRRVSLAGKHWLLLTVFASAREKIEEWVGRHPEQYRLKLKPDAGAPLEDTAVGFYAVEPSA